jgi:hypothetical protein
MSGTMFRFSELQLEQELFSGSNSSSCGRNTNCDDCVGTFASNNGCVWCSNSGICISDSDESCPNDDEKNTCSSSYYMTIFIIVVAALLFLCCASCILRRFNHRPDGSLLVPILGTDDRANIFRNSLFDSGEVEWMCVICGFDNKPRVKFCNMCGTSYDFSINYNVQKDLSKQRSSYSAPIKQDKGVSRSSLSSGSGGGGGPGSSGMKDIVIPKDQQILEQSRHSLSHIRSSLTEEERYEALNYRRLNQLSLRQKGARRRRMWQRVFNPESGEFVWVRTNFQEGMFKNRERDSSLSQNTSTTITNQSVNFYPSMSMTCTNPLVSPARQSQATDQPRQVKNDSFDGVLNSMSPGYSSYLDESGHINWEKIESGPRPSHNTERPSGAAAPTPFHQSTGPPRNYAAALMESIPLPDYQTVLLLPFTEKLLYFHEILSSMQRPWTDGHIRVEIHRNNILADSYLIFMSLSAKTSELHRWIRVHFIGESGIDAGGLEREWLLLLTQQIFELQTGLFVSTNNGSSDTLTGVYHINPLSHLAHPNHLLYFQFVGRLFAKAILEQQQIPATLSLPLRKQILGIPITFSDLEFVDLELYQNLIWLKDFYLHHSSTTVETAAGAGTGDGGPKSDGSKEEVIDEIESLGLVFAVDYQYGSYLTTYDLIPNGKSISVTRNNLPQYLELRLKHRLFDSIKQQLEFFLKGFYEIIPLEFLSIFDYQELELLMCGIPTIDLDDWMRHTEYLGEYNRLGDKHKVIKWFWEVLMTFSDEEKVRLVQFVTGCSRLPAQGFKALQSNDGVYRKFNIQSIRKEVRLSLLSPSSPPVLSPPSHSLVCCLRIQSIRGLTLALTSWTCQCTTARGSWRHT